MVTFIGALIVSITFIVREGIGENLQDSVDSLESAQGIFTLQRENAVMSTRITEIYRTASATYPNVLSPPPGGLLSDCSLL